MKRVEEEIEDIELVQWAWKEQITVGMVVGIAVALFLWWLTS